MLLKETIHKSKSLVSKTIRNLKSFFFGGYQKLPKSFSFNSFSCGSRKLKNCKTDQVYTDLYEEWEAQLDEISKRENKVVATASALEKPMKEEENACSGNLNKLAKKSPVKSKQEVAVKEKKKSGSSHQGKGKESNSRSAKDAGHVLAQKMKELEMIDSGDMEQALDIEEAIHYYSRLKSPVYLDIVDKFFVDMYAELSVPHASAKISNSKRRRGSFRM